MSDSANQVLHDATFELLDRVGVRIDSQTALRLLAEHGVRADMEQMRAYPEPGHVEQALSTAPRTFTLYGRTADRPLVIGGDDVYAMAGGASVRVLTLEGQYETATWEHLRQFNVLLDALENLHVLLNQVDPQDEGGEHFYRRVAAEMLTGTPKPCCLQVGDADDVAAIAEMAAVIRGSREALGEKPLFMTGTNAEPPLWIPEDAAEILLAASAAGIPCAIGDYVMMGITGPRTVAGALVQRNAVQLTALVLSQLTQAGAPFYYAASSGSSDLRTLDPVMADPLAVSVLRRSAELGRFYGLPVSGLSTTDARKPDPQAACESTATFLAAMHGGAHLIQGPTSMMDQMMLSSYAQAVIDNDIVGYVIAAHAELDVSAESLALDAIVDVVTDPQLKDFKFAAHPHTAKLLRGGAWHPRVFDHRNFHAWQRDGCPSVVERAESLAREILENHCPEPLPDDMVAEIRRIARMTM